MNGAGVLICLSAPLINLTLAVAALPLMNDTVLRIKFHDRYRQGEPQAFPLQLRGSNYHRPGQ